jgi:hypothetical protein
MSHPPRIHLVSYATPQFRHRQIILGLSARLNGVVDTSIAWTTNKLKSEGFAERVPGIGLDERGSGFWSWKPFIIQKHLNELPEGDVLLYCDVGRIYPFKLLDQPLNPYLRWMEEQGQEVMPGIEIPWDGPMSHWTKREALLFLDLDRPEILGASPLQASFSVWKSGDFSKRLADKWMNLCARRNLVSDDPSTSLLGEHSDFRENRHDQALLSLLCIKEGVSGLFLGKERPCIDIRNPSQVSRVVFEENPIGIAGRILRVMVYLIENLEKIIKKIILYNKY